MDRNNPTLEALRGEDGPRGAQPTRVRYRVLAAGLGLALVVYIQRLAFVRAVPYIQNDLGIDSEQMGYLASAFLIAYGIFQLPYGWLGDRFGARHFLTILVLGWSLCTGATALAAAPGLRWPFAFLLALRFLFGMFQAGGFPVWARVMTDWIPLTQRASAQGAVWMFSRLGGAVSPFLVFWLIEYFGTWTTPLWVVSSLGVVWCAAFWPWFRNRPEEMHGVNAAERELIHSGRAVGGDVHDSLPWSTIVGSGNVWALSAMYGCVGFAGNFMTNLLPLYLANYRHLSQQDTTWLSGLPLACGMFSSAIGGLISDWVTRRWQSRKWGRRINAALGLALAGLTLLAVPWVEDVWLLAVVLGASFFFNDLNIAPAWAACADVGERYTGTISGAMNMVGQFGGAAGLALAGLMLQRGYSELLFPLLACSYGLAACCWLAVDVTLPLRPPDR